MDETGWRQERQRAWLWTVVTAELTVFRIDRSRSGTVVEALLGSDFAGWSGRTDGQLTGGSRPSGELSAILTALVDRGGEAEPVGRWGLAEIERLFALWHHFRAGEFDRLALLQARMGRLCGQENPDRKAAGLCRELAKCWPALWTFARVEGVAPTNNVSERALRPAVLWRKGSFGSDSIEGSCFAERLLTVVATCRKQGRHLLDFLVAAGEATLWGCPPPSVLPNPQTGWALTRHDVHRRSAHSRSAEWNRAHDQWPG